MKLVACVGAFALARAAHATGVCENANVQYDPPELFDEATRSFAIPASQPWCDENMDGGTLTEARGAVSRQSAALRVGVAQLREHRLRVPRDQFVQDGAFGCPATIAGERLSGRAGRPFVEATREHALPQWKFRAAIPERSIAIFRFALSAPRTTATPSAIDSGVGASTLVGGGGGGGGSVGIVWVKASSFIGSQISPSPQFQ